MAAGFISRRAVAFASLACFLALVGAAAPAGAQCGPTPSSVELCGATWYTYDPVFQQNRTCSNCWPDEGCFGPGASARLDHVAGTLNASIGVGRDAAYTYAAAQADLADDYWLEGPPAANPIGVRIRLAVAVTGCQPYRGEYGVRLGYPFQGGAARLYGTLSGTECYPAVALADTIVLEQAVVVGQPFAVFANVTIEHGLYYGATISGALAFTGLPPGYQVRSCKGYGAPVPTLSSSWGALKLRYH